MTRLEKFIDDMKILNAAGWELQESSDLGMCFIHEPTGRIVLRKRVEDAEITLAEFTESLISADPLTNMFIKRKETK